jgi:putative hemolysin
MGAHGALAAVPAGAWSPGEFLANSALVLLFVLIGAFFAAAEIALVSLRESQVRKLAERGRRGARVAKLSEDPNRFLSAVQIGVTLATLLSGAFGAATLADDVTPLLVRLGLPPGGQGTPDVAGTVSLVGITLVITYFSLVLGELAPKRLGLQWAEGLSLRVAPFLDWLAKVSRPAIWLLSVSTNVVVRMVGGDPKAGRETMSAEELRTLVAGHEELTVDERSLIEEVFSAGDRQLREVLVPRTEVEFLDSATPLYKAARFAAASPHSRFPVYRDSHDEVIGFVHVRDLLNPEFSGRSLPVAEVVRPVKYLPGSKRVLHVLSEMRREGHHLAIVIDEYGGTAGIVTLEDLVEELIGDIRDEYDIEAAQARRLHGGAVEVDGLLNLDAFAGETGIVLPDGPYETVAGYIMAMLGHLPQVGESVQTGGHRLVVIEMDGRRVARVRVTPPLPGPAQPGGDSQADAAKTSADTQQTAAEGERTAPAKRSGTAEGAKPGKPARATGSARSTRSTNPAQSSKSAKSAKSTRAKTTGSVKSAKTSGPAKRGSPPKAAKMARPATTDSSSGPSGSPGSAGPPAAQLGIAGGAETDNDEPQGS